MTRFSPCGNLKSSRLTLKTRLIRRLAGIGWDRGDLYGALRFGAVNSQLANCRVDSARHLLRRLLLTAGINLGGATCAGQLSLRQSYPLGDVVSALLDRYIPAAD